MRPHDPRVHDPRVHDPRVHDPRVHDRQDVAEPAPSTRSDLLAHVPRATPEVMESIAVALLSLTAPGVCLRAEAGGGGPSAERPPTAT
ncbi:hypothetical protein ACFY0F_01875 [Streptomyces sp. NPDC001544]|uniref:hypothetical protein n=1 Tax=Streptomyces sp. NPDC001544 TaxID=3364584 RepID=UPI0036C97B79